MSARRFPNVTEPRRLSVGLIRRLQVLAIRTNVPPISAAYAGLYALVSRLTVAWLRARFGDELAAVYLRGSTVIDVSVPGLSDIDLTLVLNADVGAERQEVIVDAWRRVARRVSILEESPWVLTPGEFRRLARDNPAIRYRIMEAQGSWKVVLGRDVMAGCDDYSRIQRLHAVVDDLELRLTYLNGMLFDEHPSDGLQRIHLEYTFYKLTIDLARALAFRGDGPLLSRGAAAAGFVRADLEVEIALGCGDDQELRDFVEFTRRYRLRRSYFSGDGPSAMAMAGRLLDLTLRTLQRAYADDDLMALPSLRDQHEHFYADGHFLPTGSVARQHTRALPVDLTAFCAEVKDARRAGTHTVLVARGLWVNLANTNPALGNCTVVPAPHRASPTDR